MSPVSSMHLRLWCGVFLIAVAVGARAQQTTKVRVKLIGRCPQAKTLTLIVRGDELSPITLTPDETDKSNLTWKGEWSGDVPESLDAAGTVGSLRFGGARTDCRSSASAPDPELPFPAKVALFRFHCDEEPTANVKIEVSPRTVVVYYDRHLDRDLAIPASVDCDEQGSMTRPTRIKDLRFPDETLGLHIGYEKPPAAHTPGLRVSAELAASGQHLDRQRVAELLAEQRAAGNGSAPNASPNAYDMDIKRLEKSNLAWLELKRD